MKKIMFTSLFFLLISCGSPEYRPVSGESGNKTETVTQEITIGEAYRKCEIEYKNSLTNQIKLKECKICERSGACSPANENSLYVSLIECEIDFRYTRGRQIKLEICKVCDRLGECWDQTREI